MEIGYFQEHIQSICSQGGLDEYHAAGADRGGRVHAVLDGTNTISASAVNNHLLYRHYLGPRQLTFQSHR